MKKIILFFLQTTLLLSSYAADSPPPARAYWALLVGVGEYKFPESGLSRLKYADNDAEDVYKLLLKLGWKKGNIKKITGIAADRRSLSGAVNGWLRRVAPGDLLLIYWAGHGYPDLADQRRVYFACYDTDMKKPWTGYRMDKVVKSVREHGIRNVVFIADTCHAGKIVTRSDGRRGLSIQPFLADVPRNKDIPPGWVFMAAVENGKKSVENAKWKNGVFTYCFLNAASGGAARNQYGLITLGSIRDYLEKKVPVEAAEVTAAEITPLIVTNSAEKKIWDITLQLKEKNDD